MRDYTNEQWPDHIWQQNSDPQPLPHPVQNRQDLVNYWQLLYFFAPASNSGPTKKSQYVPQANHIKCLPSTWPLSSFPIQTPSKYIILEARPFNLHYINFIFPFLSLSLFKTQVMTPLLYNKLWINSLCLLPLDGLRLFVFSLSSHQDVVCIAQCHGSLLSTWRSNHTVPLCLAAHGWSVHDNMWSWYRSEICFLCLGYLFTDWYTDFVIGFHLFGILGRIKAFLFILFCSLCASVLCVLSSSVICHRKENKRVEQRHRPTKL